MPPFVSCFTNCYGASGVREAVKNIRKAGLNHLELALRGHNFGGLVIPEAMVITEAADDLTAQAFVELLHQNEVKISGCNVGGADLLTKEGVELTHRRIQFAKRWFDVNVVISGAGQPANATERTVILDHLRQIGDLCRDLGMTLALETHKGPTQNAAAMLDLMSDLDHSSVRINFDTGNIGYYNHGLDVVDELNKVKSWVSNVHLKDNRGRFEDWYFPAIGDGGAVDFRKVRTTLEESGYSGAYTIEIEGIGGEPDPSFDVRQERIKRSVDHLTLCGYFEGSKS